MLSSLETFSSLKLVELLVSLLFGELGEYNGENGLWSDPVCIRELGRARGITLGGLGIGVGCGCGCECKGINIINILWDQLIQAYHN